MTDIKERPILFSAPMVRAILEGRKTVTRRAVKVQPHDDATIEVDLYNPVVVDRRGIERPGPEIFGAFSDDGLWGAKCPYGQPGDRLWVRETHADIGCRLTYRADTDDGAHCQVKKWTPAIHMFRRHSRILLEITEVRVERLQDLNDEQAQAEGIIPVPKTTEDSHQFWRNYHLSGDGTFCVRTPKESFKSLWCHVAGGSFPKGEAAYKESPHSWDANPWVWVVEFKQVRP